MELDISILDLKCYKKFHIALAQKKNNFKVNCISGIYSNNIEMKLLFI